MTCASRKYRNILLKHQSSNISKILRFTFFNVSFDPIYFLIKMIQIRIQHTHMMIFHNFGWLAHPGNIKIFCWNTNLQIYIEYIKVHVFQCIFWSNIYSDKIWFRFGFMILIWWYSITLDHLRIQEISKYSDEIPIF